jgi:prepilin-type processing-associated H-X9-DG protein
MRETSGRQRCPSNLRQIGQAILLYLNENKGQFPRTVYDPTVPPVWGTGASSSEPFAGPLRPADNDVTAALFLLMRTQDITPAVFVCGSTGVKEDPLGGAKDGARGRSNFTDWRGNLSYSLANPYANLDEPRRHHRVTKEGAFPLAADMNPGVGDDFDPTAATETSNPVDLRRANSRSHQGVGQNVLYADGHVSFEDNPFCGVKRDNIYTVSGSADGSVTTSKTIVGAPAWDGDAVLLPPLR